MLCLHCHEDIKTKMYQTLVKCPYQMQIINHWIDCSVKNCMKYKGMCYLLSGRYNTLWKQNIVVNERIFYFVLRSELKKGKQV